MSQESPSNQKPLYAEIRYDHDKTEDIVLISYLTVKEDGVYERFKPKNNNDYSKKAKYKCQYLECTDNEECNSNMCDHEIQNLRIRILRLGASEEDIKNRQETETTRNPGPPKRFQSDSSSDNDLKNKAAAKDNFVPAKKAQKSHNKGIGMSVLESLNNKQAPKMISQEILSQPRISVIDYKVKEDELRVREESIRRQENDIAKRIEDIREKENELVIRERIIENRMRGAGNRAEQVYEEETEEEEDNNNI